MRKLTSLLLALMACITFANAAVYNGTCGAEGDGSNLTWTFNTEDSTLTISGSGAMKNYTAKSPWYSYGKNLAHVIINEGATNIGNHIFHSCFSIKSITIPNSVTSIGNAAFYYVTGLSSLTIPNSVSNICDSAFYTCKGLTSIDIPNSVTSIGSKAFMYCENLTSVTIGNNVTNIGGHAFYGTVLTSVTIPNSVTSIGDYVFGSGGKLETINVDTGNPNYCSIDGVLFSKDQTRIIKLPGTRTGQYSIPNGVTHIEKGAFYNNTGLTSVDIPNSVTSIGDNAFYGTGLTSVTIPNSVTSIGKHAFHDCSKLKSAILSNQITSFEYGTFEFCTQLSSIEIPNGVINIGEAVFTGCSRLSSVIIPNSVTTIDINAFSSCGLTSVIIPGSVTNMGNAAFQNNKALTSVTIENGVTSIGNSAFYGCNSLASVTIPNGVTSIGGNAFSDCYGLTSVTIPNSVTNIGDKAFYYCTGLTSVYLNCETPPTITNKNIFVKCPCSVYVPCGSLEAYMSDTYWSQLASTLSYEPTSYTISAIPSSYGSVTINSTVCEDTTITAVPDEGYHFVQWTDGNTDNPRQIELTQDTTFEAVFAPIQYTLNVEWNGDAGRVEGEIGTFDYLTSHTIQAIPNDGYVFVKWSDGITTNPRTISLTNDIYLEAIFVTNRLKVDFVDWDGTILKTDSVDYNGSATPPTENPRREGYTFYGWDKSFSKIQSDLIVTALYLQKPPTDMPASEVGAINGVFSIAEGRQVVFSKGNLQYNAAQGTHACADGTTQQGTWRFAEEQYDARLSENLNRSETYDGWIDLFSYGASGYNGMIPYRRTQIGYNDPMYQQIGALQGSYYDFGLYNAISNGGNQPGMWRMFTLSEWEYIIRERAKAYRLRAHANINGTNGLILLPDNCDTIALRKIATFNPSDNAMNNYSLDVWNRIEALGAVFLPAANSIRAYNENEFYLNSDGTVGAYMCAYNKQQASLEVGYFSSEFVGTAGIPGQYIPVRLVQDVDIFHLNAVPNNSAWGTVTGETLYWNEAISQTATPNEGYHFVQWSDGNTDNPRAFTLTSDSTITAEFAPNTYSLSVTCDAEQGSITGESGTFDYLSEHTFEAVANYGYTFNRWSDGVTTNPRTIVLTKDSTITALYELGVNTDFIINFNTKDGDEILSNDIVLKVPAAPKIDGFTFVGWRPVADIIEGNTIDIEAVYTADESTAAPAVVTNPANPAQKLIREGNVYILKGNKIYSITGQQVK